MACASKTDYKRRLRESPPEIFHTQHLQKTLSIISEGVKEYVVQQKMRDVPIIAQVDPKSRVSYEMNVTPQTMLIDSRGKVEKLWIGMLSADERNEVEQSFSLKLPEIRLSHQFSDRTGPGTGRAL
jgi:hypothetical protein